MLLGRWGSRARSTGTTRRQEFCLNDVFTDTVAEICPLETQARAIRSLYDHRTDPEVASGKFQTSLQFLDIVTTTQELIALVVICLDSGFSQDFSLFALSKASPRSYPS